MRTTATVTSHVTTASASKMYPRSAKKPHAARTTHTAKPTIARETIGWRVSDNRRFDPSGWTSVLLLMALSAYALHHEGRANDRQLSGENLLHSSDPAAPSTARLRMAIRRQLL